MTLWMSSNQMSTEAAPKKFKTPPSTPRRNMLKSFMTSSSNMESPNENHSPTPVKEISYVNNVQTSGLMTNYPSPRALRDRLRSLGIADITNVPTDITSPSTDDEQKHDLQDPVKESIIVSFDATNMQLEREERETFRRRLRSHNTETSTNISEKSLRVNQLEQEIVEKVQKLSTFTDSDHSSEKQIEDLSRINHELQEQLEILTQTHHVEQQKQMFVDKQLVSIQAEMISWKNLVQTKESDMKHLSETLHDLKNENAELKRKVTEYESHFNANEFDLKESHTQNQLQKNKIELLERLTLEANIKNAHFSQLIHLADEKLDRLFPSTQMTRQERANMDFADQFQYWLDTITSNVEQLKYENIVRDTTIMDRDSFILKLQLIIDEETLRIGQSAKDDSSKGTHILEETLGLDETSKYILVSKIRKTFDYIAALQDGLDKCRLKLSGEINEKTKVLEENNTLKVNIDELLSKISKERSYRDSIEEKLDDACQQLVHFISLNDELNHEVTIQSRINSTLRDEINGASYNETNYSREVIPSPDSPISKHSFIDMKLDSDLILSFLMELKGSSENVATNDVNALSSNEAVIEYTRWLQNAYKKELQKNITLQDEISAAAAVFTATAVEMFNQRRENLPPRIPEQDLHDTSTYLIDKSEMASQVFQSFDIEQISGEKVLESHDSIFVKTPVSTSAYEENSTDVRSYPKNDKNEYDNLRAMFDDEKLRCQKREAEMNEKHDKEVTRINYLMNEIQVRDDMITQLKMELTNFQIQAYKCSSLSEELKASYEIIDKLRMEIADTHSSVEKRITATGNGDDKCINQAASIELNSEYELEMQKIIESELEDFVMQLREKDDTIDRMKHEVAQSVNKIQSLQQELDQIRAFNVSHDGNVLNVGYEFEVKENDGGKIHFVDRHPKTQSRGRNDVKEERTKLVSREFDSPVIREKSPEQESANVSFDSQYSRLSTLEEKFVLLSDELERLHIKYPPSHSSSSATSHKKRRHRRATTAIIRNDFSTYEVEEAEV